MKKKILCAGEILFDFIASQKGKTLGKSERFEKRPGGAPFNICVGLSRLGAGVDFLTKIGDDAFGEELYSLVAENRIGTENVFRGEGMNSTLVFVAVDENGKPDFKFYRENAADTAILAEETEKINLNDYSIFQFGSVALLDNPTRDSILSLFHKFRGTGKITSFDPNIRESMIRDRVGYLEMTRGIFEKADIIKMSDDDLKYFYPESTVESALDKINSKKDALVIITLGSKGTMYRKSGRISVIPGFKVQVRETTGCGDSFMAAIVYRIWKSNINSIGEISFEEAGNMVEFANAQAAIVASRFGAANSMPYLGEVEEFLKLN